MVVIFWLKLFNHKTEISMIISKQVFVSKNNRHSRILNLLKEVLIIKIFKNSGTVDSTKFKIEYRTTQGIANNDVINRTKLRKWMSFKSQKETFNEFIHLCNGFVCGMLNVNNTKIEIQPLTVFKKNYNDTDLSTQSTNTNE
ncbi:hypothetical protein UMM65_12055 [Aureibaculum sp. 2210JD6-5]|uniref:hypothetical protein n=1 Tax=Aureibaculum sp. 2210JD6-5 TaxID=3103957 RepID=UPI002AAD5174|nr:hypothetical protein [Aureibaculum sp. 2210JD6-5]MDY7395982.1 hypothetical protein [Aureibaculum sp. 2210JD6-5]